MMQPLGYQTKIRPAAFPNVSASRALKLRRMAGVSTAAVMRFKMEMRSCGRSQRLSLFHVHRSVVGETLCHHSASSWPRLLPVRRSSLLMGPVAPRGADCRLMTLTYSGERQGHKQKKMNTQL